MEALSYIDLAIVSAYFVLIFVIGLYFSGKEKNSESYFLADRRATWPMIGASIFVTNISGEHFVGLAGAGYDSGLKMANYELTGAVSCLILGWLFAPLFLKSAVVTVPEFLEKRFGPEVRWFMSILSITGYVFTKIAATLFAGALLLNNLLGLDFYASSMVLVIVTGIYSVSGGMKAIIYTHFIQAIFIIGGAVLFTFYCLDAVGGPVALWKATPDSHLHLLRFGSDNVGDSVMILAGAFVTGVWYWCGDQYIAQRIMSARNINEAKSGSILAGYLKLLPLFIMVIPGMAAAVLYPGIEPDRAFPMLVANVLPRGAMGLVLTAVLAGLMSSLATCFNSTSTLFTHDIYKKLYPKSTEKDMMTVGRFATFAAIASGMLWVPFVEKLSGNLYTYIQTIQATIAAPVAAVLLMGVFWPRTSSKAAMYVLVMGTLLGILKLASEWSTADGSEGFSFLQELNYASYAVAIFGVCVGLLFMISIRTPSVHKGKLLGTTVMFYDRAPHSDYSVEHSEARKNNLIASLILLALIVAVYVLLF